MRRREALASSRRLTQFPHLLLLSLLPPPLPPVPQEEARDALHHPAAEGLEERGGGGSPQRRCGVPGRGEGSGATRGEARVCPCGAAAGRRQGHLGGASPLPGGRYRRRERGQRRERGGRRAGRCPERAGRRRSGRAAGPQRRAGASRRSWEDDEASGDSTCREGKERVPAAAATW